MKTMETQEEKEARWKREEDALRGTIAKVEPIVKPTSGERVIGIHDDCGGEIVYHWTPTRGFRVCQKCKADGMHGRPAPSTVEEAKSWK